jgi:hypothetical protein
MAPATDLLRNDFSVEVNFVGRELDPDRLTSILELQPTNAARAGQPRNNGRGNAAYQDGFWVYEVSSNDEINECRDHQLNCLVDAVAPKVDQLRAAGVERIYFYYTLSSFAGMLNIRFKAETLQKLGGIDADLYVSCFDCFNPKFLNDAIIGDGIAIADGVTLRKESATDSAEA